MALHYLSAADVAAFERDGFLVVRGMYGRAEIDEVGRWIDELAARPPERGKQMVYFEDSLEGPRDRILSRIEKFVDYHAGMRRFVSNARLVGMASELLGEPAVLFKEKVNFKLPGGGGFKPHQDIQPGWDEYADYFLSMLVTIDPSTVENGCLELAAGHHKRGWIGQKHRPLEGAELEGIEFEKYPMQPGDVALFDCFVPHQSAPNRTDKPRRNLYLTFNRQSAGDHRERYFADKRKSFPDHEREPGKQYVFKV